ncbi:MAG: MCP four helix bundle domain-containing protein [Anaerotignum sp.]|nr:MCP four helix bundle domain-containing protein [Anaerotignum sp.]
MKKWFEDVNVSKKLNVGFLFTAFLGLIIGVVGIISMLSMISSQQRTYDECTMGIVYSSGAESSYKDLRTSIRNLYIYYNTDNEKYYEEISNEADTVQSQLNNYSKTISSDQDQQNLDATQTAYENYTSVVDDIVQTAKAGGTKDSILALIEKAELVADEAASEFNALAQYNEVLSQENLSSEKTAAWTAIIIMIAIIVISIALAILLG